MVQSVESFNKPTYSAVNIHITKPEVNAAQNADNGNDNGIYNSVKIDIDNPTANTSPKIYDYPEAEKAVTYDQINPSVQIPKGLISASAHYEPTTNNQEEIETISEGDIVPVEEFDIPEPNYTTLEEEKGGQAVIDEKKTLDSVESTTGLQFKAAPTTELKRPEIIPSEEIKPDLDVDLIISNLNNENFDVQAQQLEEITRIGLLSPNDAKPYIIKEIISPIINIIKKDTSGLVKPTEQQFIIRDKIIANDIIAEIAKTGNKKIEPPYKLTDEEIRMSEITSFEQAERNKGYAISAIAVLSKLYIDGVEKDSGNVVPFTEIPGIAEMVDTLRYSHNTNVKIAALDGLRHIARPEYKKELEMIFAIAQNDKDKEVAQVASLAYSLISQDKVYNS